MACLNDALVDLIGLDLFHSRSSSASCKTHAKHAPIDNTKQDITNQRSDATMPRNTDNPVQALQAAVQLLQGCGPALSSVRVGLLDLDISRPNALRRCTNQLEDTKADLTDAIEQLRGLASQLVASEQYWITRGDNYKTDLGKSETTVQQLTEALSAERQHANDLQRQLDEYKEDLEHAERSAKRKAADQEQTINDLKRQLRTANRRLEQYADAANQASPTSPGHLDPSSAGGQGRPSSDSGFSEASNATEPGDRTRQRLAKNLLEEGVQDFKCGQFKKADSSFAQVQDFVRQLPTALGSAFDSATLAYYRAVCHAETGTSEDAQRALTAFLQSHDQAAVAQQAHVKHILARTCVKQGRLDDAFGHSCNAVGLWYDIDQTNEHYLNAVALLARIYALQGKLADAVGAINLCPAERRDYVRSKYASLQPLAASTQPAGSQVPPTRPTVILPTRPTAINRPGRPQIVTPTRPVVAPPSSVGSGGTTSTAASRRRKNVQKLPWIFRAALT